MSIWFTVEEEKPDIGTVIFKADNYYERLQHLTGMWNENNFLYYDMFRSTRGQHYIGNEEGESKLFQVTDVADIPTLLAYLEKANLKGVLPAATIDFMYDLHRLYVNKMCEFGFPTRRMSKKEYDLLENQEKWTRLMKAMEELRVFNLKEESDAKKRKRKLQPAIQTIYTRIDSLPTRSRRGRDLKKLMGKRRSTNNSSLIGDYTTIKLDNDNTMLINRGSHSRVKKFFFKTDYENPFSWDFGKTRTFDRKHVKNAGKHMEFTRFCHKIAKALRFSNSEPVDWRTISLEEVDKHRYFNDCWMVIKGRVYDVTSYLKDHPGGHRLIMQGAGIDATEVFVAVHPYVVFYKHLQRLQIGTVVDFQEHFHTEWEPPANFDMFRILKEWAFRSKHPLAQYKPKMSFEQNDTYYVYSVTFPSSLESSESDWIITIRSGFEVTIIKFIEPPFVWYGGFDLRIKVVDDTAYHWFSEDFNTLELKIAKPYISKIRRPIKDWRQDHNFFLSSYSLKDKFRVSVVERTRIADGVQLYGICAGLNKFVGCPLGCYVNFRILDETRPYTPVCLPDEFEKKYVDDSGDFQTLFFIIKEFKDGNFTSMLHYLPIKRILKGVDLYISPPMGNFQPSFLFSNMDIMLLIAGGTGISVMTRIIQEYIAQKEKMVGTAVCLIFFVQHRNDLIWKDVWMELDRKHHWFHFFYSLTRVYRYQLDKDDEVDGGSTKVTEDSHAKHNAHEGKGGKILKHTESKQPSKSDKGTESGGKHTPNKAADKTGKSDKDGAKKRKKEIPRLLEFDPENNPHELYGYPTSTKLRYIYSVVKGAYEMECHKAIVCGPFGFNHNCEQMLKSFGKHTEDSIYYFSG